MDKPIPLTNYLTGEIHYDTLHKSIDRVSVCGVYPFCLCANQIKFVCPHNEMCNVFLAHELYRGCVQRESHGAMARAGEFTFAIRDPQSTKRG